MPFFQFSLVFCFIWGFRKQKKVGLKICPRDALGNSQFFLQREGKRFDPFVNFNDTRIISAAGKIYKIVK